MLFLIFRTCALGAAAVPRVNPHVVDNQRAVVPPILERQPSPNPVHEHRLNGSLVRGRIDDALRVDVEQDVNGHHTLLVNGCPP